MTLCLITVNGCSSKNDSTIQQNTTVWQVPEYSICSLTLYDGLKFLPGDLGVTIYNTNLATRYDSLNSMRPYLITKKNTIIDLSRGLDFIPYQTRISFDYWSSDGNTAYVWTEYKDPQNAMWEEANKQLRFNQQFYKADIIALDLKNNNKLNFTDKKNVSYYNQTIFLWPANQNKIGFHAFVDNSIQPYLSDVDGKNKIKATKQSQNSYAINASADGTLYAYHADYQIFIGDIKKNKEVKLSSNCKFQFIPIWSPNSKHLAFLCGDSSTNANLYLADRNGKNVKLIQDRGGYSGIVKILDIEDFHGGGSDYFVWTPDSKSIILAVQKNDKTELVKVDITNPKTTQLTHSLENTTNHYPNISKNGRWLTYVSNQKNQRNVFMMDLNQINYPIQQITDLDKNCGAFEPMWRP